MDTNVPRTIQNLYWGQKAMVRLQFAKEVDIERGVRQVRALSPPPPPQKKKKKNTNKKCNLYTEPIFRG